jgi:hypothetical protein
VADLLIAPYLALSDTVRVGPWELCPFKAVAASGIVPSALSEAVSRLIEAYSLPKGAGSILGAVAYPHGSNVGAPFEQSAMRLLGHALLAGALANNPEMAHAKEGELSNAGHAVATSENALLYGHPIEDGQACVTESGVLVRAAHIRFAPADKPLPKIAPPSELPTLMFGSFDDELSDATYAALSASDASSRRLSRALDWYRIALSNADAVTLDVRVGAARSALEALTGANEKTKLLVRAYGVLMRDQRTTETTYNNVFWANGPVQLTPDEWWLTRLCDLRNHIVHGDEIPDDLWQHEGFHQLNHMHDRLISCLKLVVAAHAENQLLRLPRVDRMFQRAHEEAEQYLRDH